MQKAEYEKLGFEYVGEVKELISFAGKFLKLAPKHYREKIKVILDIIIKVKSIVLYVNNGIVVYKIVDVDKKPKMRSIKNGEKIKKD